LNLLQLNKFGTLHDGKKVFFCKTDYLEAEFKQIKKIKNEVVLISGNSDINIDEKLASQMPGNIVTWYAQNTLIDDARITPIPIGIENTVLNKRKGHGVGWLHAVEKTVVLQKAFDRDDVAPTRFLYANFNTETNQHHRMHLKKICQNTAFITWADYGLHFGDFIAAIQDHEAVICPLGNGVDTHRLYEVLYSNRIPVVAIPANYAICQKLYKHLPIVMVDDPDKFSDFDLMKQMIADAKVKWDQINLIDFDYWQNKIQAEADAILHRPKSIFSYLFK
jgi:hypothetical protein